MKGFTREHQLQSTNNSLKSEEDSNLSFAFLSKNEVTESRHYQVKCVTIHPVEQHTTIRRIYSEEQIIDGSENTSPDSEDQWLEVCNVQDEDSDTGLCITSGSNHEKTNKTVSDGSMNELFPERSQSEPSFQYRTSKQTDCIHPANATVSPQKTVTFPNVNLPSNFKTAEGTSAGPSEECDLITNTTHADRLSVFSLPPLDSLPAKHIEISSPSSLLSLASINGSIEGTEQENINPNNQTAPDLEDSIESESFVDHCTDSKSDVNSKLCDRKGSLFFNKTFNMSEIPTGWLQREKDVTNKLPLHTEQSQSTKLYRHTKQMNDYLSHVSSATAVEIISTDDISCRIIHRDLSNQKQPEKCERKTTAGSDSEDFNVHIINVVESLNVSNTVDTSKELKSDDLKKLPPLPPIRRRSRTLSYSGCQRSVSDDKALCRPTTPPASYQRHELLDNNQENGLHSSNPNVFQKFCFPYPSLVRYPSPVELKQYTIASTTISTALTPEEESKRPRNGAENVNENEGQRVIERYEETDYVQKQQPEMKNAKMQDALVKTEIIPKECAANVNMDNEKLENSEQQQGHGERSQVTMGEAESQGEFTDAEHDDDDGKNDQKYGFSCCTLL